MTMAAQVSAPAERHSLVTMTKNTAEAAVMATLMVWLDSKNTSLGPSQRTLV